MRAAGTKHQPALCNSASNPGDSWPLFAVVAILPDILIHPIERDVPKIRIIRRFANG